MSREPVVGRHPSLATLMPERGLAKVRPGPSGHVGSDMVGGTAGSPGRGGVRGGAGARGAAAGALGRAGGQARGRRSSITSCCRRAASTGRCATRSWAGPGDTWAWRAAHGRVPGVEPDAAVQALARSQVGLFEVWPGRPAVLRGRIRGLCLRIDDPLLAVAGRARADRSAVGAAGGVHARAGRGCVARRSRIRSRSCRG
jgi:hypothetical protein